MTEIEDSDYEAYERAVLEQVRKEAAGDGYSSLMGIRIVDFISYSNGKHRKRRRPREVSLLQYGGCTFQIKSGELKSRKNGLAADVISMEALSFLPIDERSPDRLIEEVRKRQDRNKYVR